MIDTMMMVGGLVSGVVASIIWQERIAPWLRKRKQYKQRVATRRAKKSKGERNESET
jgi:preprotein translocase subunit SecF